MTTQTITFTPNPIGGTFTILAFLEKYWELLGIIAIILILIILFAHKSKKPTTTG